MKLITILFLSVAMLVSVVMAEEPSGFIEIADGHEIAYYDMNSATARTQTRLFREAQEGLITEDNGEDIVFCLSTGIYVQFADGTGRRLLIGRGGYAALVYPAWSLDGRRIAFAAKYVNSRYVDLYVANADGTDLMAILTLCDGFYESNIQSLSWHWGDQTIMFNYAYDDNQGNDYFMLHTINYDGTSWVFLDDFVRSYSQYEPVNNSLRYAYLTTGTIFDQNSRLRVSNLDGSNDQIWMTYSGIIAGFTHVCWNNTNSIYTIIRWWDQYPNREVLLRINKIGNQYSYTTIIQSDPYNSLWAPTVSPNRRQLYMAELSSQTSTLWLTTFDWSGNVIDNVSKGTGFFPNWRQEIPVGITEHEAEVAIPDKIAGFRNYPNPFNATTTIEYELPYQTNTIIKIYDILGHEVETLFAGLQPSGYNSLTWNAGDLPSGIYFLKLQVDDQTETKRLILLK